MKNPIKFLAAVCAVSIATLSTSFFVKASSQYSNEKEIEFVANSGEKTLAYEGFIRVPENRNVKNSRQIKVSYVRFPSLSKSPGAPIVYLSGGPGGSGIATAKWRRFPLFMALRQFGDVIALDQRGTGQSEKAPYCKSSQHFPLTEVVSDKEIEKRYRLAAKECIDFWRAKGADILGYTTVQNALDINDLRKHLGADKVTLWGISYGSHLAFTAMKVMEKHLDKVIIASAEGLNQTVKLPARTDEYFSKIQAVINKQPTLKAQFPDITSLIKGVHTQLEQKPLLVSIPQKDGSQIKLLFQKRHMQLLASMTISDPGQYLGVLLNLYKSLSENNTDTLIQVLQRGMFNDSQISFNLMSFGMDIASGITDARYKLVKQQAKTSLLGEQLNFPMPHLNMILPALDLGDEFRAAPKNSIPTLLLTGTLDGRTYMEGQKESVRNLSNVTHVLVENAGHNLFVSSPDVLKVMKAFLSGDKVNNHTIKTPLPNLAMK